MNAAPLVLAAAGFLTALACAGCVVRPQASAGAPPSCRAQCQSMHDRCIMDARDGQGVQKCDDEAKWCTEHCGR